VRPQRKKDDDAEPMPLLRGTRIGPYEIVTLLGAGGMGEVYRAHDTRLHREVALKVLPDGFSLDAERVGRFKREAQVLASLNHPNIAAIYGLEGDSDAALALAMEFVDGSTLADLIARGPMPVGEALAISRQITDAIDAAHAQGIVHRDLKPANVKVRPDGAVKILDFGLAKALASEPPNPTTELSHSPTLTTPAVTRIGMILGTAAYMSPEQARGRAVDKRTDIWAFGCVLYEMLTGRRPFEGDDVADTLGAVLHKEPDWHTLSSAPANVRTVLQHCLEKNPARRIRDIGDVRLALDGAFDTHDAVVPTTARGSLPHRAARFSAVALAAAMAAGVGVWLFTRTKPSVATPISFTVPPPPAPATLGQFLALSPDGRRLAFFASEAGANRLWVHTFDTGETRVLSSAGSVSGAPFWSPDSRLIAYVGEGKLKKIDPAGGPPEVIADAPQSFAGGTWSERGVVIFADASHGLMRVSAAGGTPTPLTVVDSGRKETSHTGPWFLPGGRRFLYLRSSTEAGDGGVFVGDVDAKPADQNLTRLLATQQNPQFAPARETGVGHLLFMRGGALMAQTFDPLKLELTGEARRVADQVGVGVGGTVSYGFFSVAQSGALAFRHGQRITGSAVWVSRAGQEIAAISTRLDEPSNPKLSPDEHKLALIVNGDLWVYDVEGRPPVKLTFGGTHYSPLWTRDGRRIAHEANNVVVALPADGGGAPEPMSPTSGHYHPHGWSADERDIILVAVPGPTKSPDIVRFSLKGSGDPQTVVATAAVEGIQGAALSPDGRWLAYASDETGQQEIWVRPYPGPGRATRVSPNGGVEPVWAKSGRELFYREQTRVMAVAVAVGNDLTFKPAAPLFESRYVHIGQPPTYDVAADGRFVMIKLADGAVSPFNIVLDWEATLAEAPAH
jgi:Tol biopolymer transport system component